MSFAQFRSWAGITFGGLQALLQGSQYIFAAVAIFLSVVVIQQRKKDRPQATGSSPRNGLDKSPDSNKSRHRSFGEWTAVRFTYPNITPYEKQLADIKPVPYRPFRWGPHHVTMGLRNMAWDDWIELDDQYERYQLIRAHRINTRGGKVVRVLGDNPGVVRGGSEAAIELVHELAEYLSRRYPSSFHITRHGQLDANAHTQCRYGWGDATPIKTITVVPLSVTHELPLHLGGEDAAERAMTISALLIQDDLAIMIEGQDGKHYFQAGAICVPGFWSMDHKIGKTLDEIHLSGHVPQYQEKLQPSLERFFRRLTVDKPVVRNNYFVQFVGPRNNQEEVDPEELAWSYTANGSEDDFEQGHGFTSLGDFPTPTPERLRLRTERQTLRRLPKSGAIVFTIRTYVVPVEELAKEPGVAGRLASAVASWPEDVVNYKGRERVGWGKVLSDYLARARDDEMMTEKGKG